jgi:nucleotide-binding universal stress UspA family protein
MGTIRTILHATDFSEDSTQAFQVACALAADQRSRLIVLHVYPPPICHGEEVARRPPDGYEEQLWRALCRLRPTDAAIDVEHRLVEGDAAEEIVRVAREHNCDLIVLGTHGRTGLGRLLMGSVAEKVMRGAACAVLTVKSPASAPVPAASCGVS